MKLQFRTRNKSTYIVEGDENGGYWERIEASMVSGNLRTSKGSYTRHYPIRIGHPAIFVCPPLLPGSRDRVIATSIVLEIIIEGGTLETDDSRKEHSQS